MFIAGLAVLSGISSAFSFASPCRTTRASLSQSMFETRSRCRIRDARSYHLHGLLASITSEHHPSVKVNGDTHDDAVIMATTIAEVNNTETVPHFLLLNDDDATNSLIVSMPPKAAHSPVSSEVSTEQNTLLTGADKKVNGFAKNSPADEKQRENLYPSIAISYDAQGIVQADVTANIPESYESVDYPAFIRFLYSKDVNGQTVASKLFNFALLVMSFSYVFFSVFNIDKGMTRGWTPGEISLRIPLDTWASYENSLSEKPVATKTIINVVIYLLGDWLSQTLFQGKNILDFDAARTIKNGFIGMCFGPAVHEYYEFSDWILPVDGATFGITNRAFKILMDQTIYLSIKCSIYIVAIGVLNGETMGNSTENAKNRIKPIMFTAWKFWPLVHCVTYGLIPARHRILWVNSVDLVWNAILASKARDDNNEDNDKEINGEKATKQITALKGSNGVFDLSSIMKDVAIEMEGQALNSTGKTLPTENKREHDQ